MSSSSPPVSFGFGENKVRVFSDANGEPWFVGKDVAIALSYEWKGIASIKHVPEEWRGVQSVQTPSGVQEMLTLSEQGLYFFLGRSDKPKALPFQKWLAGEVLPAIRKTGRYERKPHPLPNGWRNRRGATPKRSEEHCTHSQAQRLEAAVDLWCELCGMRRIDALAAIRVRFDLRIFDRPPLHLHEEILNWISQQSGGRVPAPRSPQAEGNVITQETQRGTGVEAVSAPPVRMTPRAKNQPLAVRPPDDLRELTRDAEDCQRRLGILTHSLALTSGKMVRRLGAFQEGGHLEDAIRDNLNAAHAAAQTALSLLKGIKNLCHAAQ